MLPAQVNNQVYKQPQAFEEPAAPTRYDKQTHQKDIANVRVSRQGESEWAEDKTCSSHTPTHVPWDHRALLSQLIKLLFPCHSLQALSCFWDWNWLRDSKKASEQVQSRGTTGQREVQTHSLGATCTPCPPAPGENLPHKPRQALSRAGRIASSTLSPWNK